MCWREEQLLQEESETTVLTAVIKREDASFRAKEESDVYIACGEEEGSVWFATTTATVT